MDWAPVVRVVGYIALLGVTGLSGAEAVVARARGDLPDEVARQVGRRALRWSAFAAWLALFAAVGRLMVQASAAGDPSEPFADALQAVMGSRWATRWLWQLAAAVIAIIWTTPVRRQVPPRLAPLGAVCLAFTLPLTGHAMDFPLGAIPGVVAQGLHVLAISLWIGTLGILLLAASGPVGDSTNRRSGALALVTAFSPFALRSAAVAVLAGVALGVVNVRTVDALFHSGYGQMLLRKLFFVGATAAVGAYNWRVVQPALRREDASPRLVKSAVVECTVALVILVFTALLSVMDAPGIQ